MERFWRNTLNTTPEEACWLWAGGLNEKTRKPNSIRLNGHKYTPQSIAYNWANDLKPGTVRVHDCPLSPLCINPAHLEPKK